MLVLVVFFVLGFDWCLLLVVCYFRWLFSLNLCLLTVVCLWLFVGGLICLFVLVGVIVYWFVS